MDLSSALLVATSAFGLISAGSGVISWLLLHPKSKFRNPLTRLPNATKTFALTFDDGPEPIWTERILECLDKWQVQASFFVLVDAVEKYPHVAQKIVACGHELEVHGARHCPPSLQWHSELHKDLQRTTQVISKISGRAPRWYRPPYGARPLLSAPYTRLGLQLVLWSWTAGDWIGGWEQSPGMPVNSVQPGEVVLLHDGATPHPRSRQRTLEVLDIILGQAKRDGLSALPLNRAVESL